MNRDEILAMPAGRELDALIAERVMGWTNLIEYTFIQRTASGEEKVTGRALKGTPPAHDGSLYPVVSVKNYSTQSAAAWMVVEKLRGDFPFEEFIVFVNELAELCDATMDDYHADIYNLMASLNPLPICRAALLATLESDT